MTNRSIVGCLFGLPFSHHLRLHCVAVLEVGLVGVGVLGINHPLSSLLLVFLLGTLLSDNFQILDQSLHFLLPDLLVALYTVDHHVDSALSLFILVCFSFLHIFFDCLGGLHSHVVFNDLDVFVDLGDLFVGVY